MRSLSIHDQPSLSIKNQRSLSIKDQRSLSIDEMFEPRPARFGANVIIRYPVSDTVLEAAYDPDSSTMWVLLPGGGPYPYFEVPREEFDEMCSAPSPGIYYNHNIRGRYLPT